MCRTHREQCFEGTQGCSLMGPGPGLPLLLLPLDPLSVSLTFGLDACSVLSKGTSWPCRTPTMSGLRTMQTSTGSTPSSQVPVPMCVPPGLWSPHFLSSLFNCLSCWLQIPTSSDSRKTALRRLFSQCPVANCGAGQLWFHSCVRSNPCDGQSDNLWLQDARLDIFL